MKAVNAVSAASRRKAYRRRPGSLLLRIAVTLAAALTGAAVLFMIIYILVRGLPYLTPEMFSLEYTSDNHSLMPALINTVSMTLLSLLIAVPLGLGAAIYLNEYAKSDSKLVGLVRLTAETLSGIPSIVYGLFGLLLFVNTLGLGFSLLAGVLTLSIMILPLMMRTAQEALSQVPGAFREGSFGLGAGKLRTIGRIVLPAAAPGVLSGVILSVGRIVGESAALIYTAGTVAQVPDSLLGSGRTLAVHMYALSSEGLFTDQAYATAVVLLVIVVGINALSAYAAKKIGAGGK